MKNFSTIQPPCLKRLDISNLLTTALLFREGVRIDEAEWAEWGVKNTQSFSPFEPLNDELYWRWCQKFFPDGVPKAPQHLEVHTSSVNVRWMPMYTLVETSDKLSAYMSVTSELITNWKLCLVYECEHKLFLWETHEKNWAEFKLDGALGKGWTNFLHAWMDWQHFI